MAEVLTQVVNGLHRACWGAVREVTVGTGLTIAYLTAEDAERLAASTEAWKMVTCAVCGDSWQVYGYGLKTSEVARVRLAVLNALVSS